MRWRSKLANDRDCTETRGMMFIVLKVFNIGVGDVVVVQSDIFYSLLAVDINQASFLIMWLK